MSKGFKITAIVLALLLLAGCTAFSAVTLFTVRAMAQEREEYEEGEFEEKATSEDGVVIAGEYTIRSTKAISDAYLSGDSSSLNKKDRETLQMASDILDDLITDGMSPYEKELAVYHWMVQHLSYDEGALPVIPTAEDDSDNPYGVLKYHNAVCVGYATTFRLFMQMLEIPCMVVHNSELFHSWDLVQLDGHWYHVDIYSDVGQTGYANFNLPDSIQLGHQNWDTDFYPAADALTYNMAWQNRADIAGIYDAPAALRQAIDTAAPAFALHFTGEMNGSETELAANMLTALDNCLMSTGYEGAPQTIRSWDWAEAEDGSPCLLVFFDYGRSGGYEEPDVDPEMWDKADAALQDAFGDIFDISIYGGNDYYDDWGGPMG